MIDVKNAVQIARSHAAEMLGADHPFSLEEIELDTYKDREVWSITLGYPKDPQLLANVFGASLQYKRFLIDSQTGDLVAIKLREVTTP